MPAFVAQAGDTVVEPLMCACTLSKDATGDKIRLVRRHVLTFEAMDPLSLAGTVERDNKVTRSRRLSMPMLGVVHNQSTPAMSKSGVTYGMGQIPIASGG